MKLIERELGLEIELEENVISIVVMENVPMRFSVIEELYEQQQGKAGNWLLIDKEKTYAIEKYVEIILEPFSLQLNNKRVKNKLYQDIKKVEEECLLSEGFGLHSYICRYIEKLFEQLPYPLKYKQEWNLMEILKAYDVELEEEYSLGCEKLFHYIKLMNEVCGINVFVALNLKKYLSKEQILELHKLVMYSKIYLVLIEFELPDADDFAGDNVYIIDEDRCIITYANAAH